MINGAHVILYSTNAKKDRDFLRNILKLPNVDVGDGWLIFGLPPSEVAIHPHSENDLHELYLMCDDIKKFVNQMLTHKIACSTIEDQGWGLLTYLTLPGGGKLGVYQPRHARPQQANPAASVASFGDKKNTKKNNSEKRKKAPVKH